VRRALWAVAAAALLGSAAVRSRDRMDAVRDNNGDEDPWLYGPDELGGFESMSL
jgi:hypothetical protein